MCSFHDCSVVALTANFIHYPRNKAFSRSDCSAKCGFINLVLGFRTYFWGSLLVGHLWFLFVFWDWHVTLPSWQRDPINFQWAKMTSKLFPVCLFPCLGKFSLHDLEVLFQTFNIFLCIRGNSIDCALWCWDSVQLYWIWVNTSHSTTCGTSWSTFRRVERWWIDLDLNPCLKMVIRICLRICLWRSLWVYLWRFLLICLRRFLNKMGEDLCSWNLKFEGLCESY